MWQTWCELRDDQNPEVQQFVFMIKFLLMFSFSSIGTVFLLGAGFDGMIAPVMGVFMMWSLSKAFGLMDHLSESHNNNDPIEP
jgi:hypothetical protein